MSIIQYTSASNSQLAKQFAKSLNQEDTIFTPIFVCVSQNTTKDWLIEQVVEEHQIAANLAFVKPLEIVEIIYKLLNLGTSSKERFQLNQLNWLIFSILDGEDFKSQFKSIADYFAEDDLKRFTLAEKIAQLFSKYQEFDHNLIQELEDFEDVGNENHISWQSFIWKELNKTSENSLCSLSNMYKDICAALQDYADRRALLKQKMPFIRLYGTISYTADFIGFLSDLGQYIDIQIFRFDTDSENNFNRLYENLGSFQNKQRSLFNTITTEVLPTFQIADATNLLTCLQQDLLNSNSSYKYQDSDDSIIISNNYSVYREVEALWNYLVGQFDSNKDLQQREVCVIIPSLEKYAAAIKAIFGNEHLKFAFTFFETTYKIQDSPYKALLALYDFDETEFTSKQVFGLLEYKYIREKFGFSEDLETIKRAIHLANIRHGIDGDQNLETDFVSWRYGLKRLIYGACLENSDDLLTFAESEFYPISEFEDRDMLELIRLNYFVETLHSFSIDKRKKKSLFDWIKQLMQAIEDFLEIEEFDTAQFNRQLDGLMKVRELMKDDISFQVMHYHLKQLFENLDQSEKIGFGGIRFSTPNPNFSISAKIICFLGMNGSDFPRTSRKLSFDLLADYKIYSASELDKNMFLNLILGAENKLYLSYIGQSVKDNSTIPPSILIDEMIDALKKYDIHEENFIVKHPLHLFSSKYNQTDKRLRRFSNQTKDKLKTISESNFAAFELNQDENGRVIIPLSDLCRFTEDPVRHYYNRVLGIYYSDNEIDLAECEAFELGHLENWGVKDALLKSHLANNLDQELFIKEKKLKGNLPFKNFGDNAISANLKEVEDLLEALKPLIGTIVNTTQAVDFEIGNYRIIGNIDGIYKDKYVFTTVSSDKMKYRIRAVVNFMILSILDKSITEGHYFTNNLNKQLSKKDCFTDYLTTLCELYEKGSTELIHFTSDFMKISCSMMEKYSTSSDLENVLSTQMSGRPPVYASEYFIKEFANGFLENEADFQKFKNVYISIIGIVESVLEN